MFFLSNKLHICQCCLYNQYGENQGNFVRFHFPPGLPVRFHFPPGLPVRFHFPSGLPVRFHFPPGLHVRFHFPQVYLLDFIFPQVFANSVVQVTLKHPVDSSTQVTTDGLYAGLCSKFRIKT